jgi:hypothetical protein
MSHLYLTNIIICFLIKKLHYKNVFKSLVLFLNTVNKIINKHTCKKKYLKKKTF